MIDENCTSSLKDNSADLILPWMSTNIHVTGINKQGIAQKYHSKSVQRHSQRPKNCRRPLL